MTDTIPLGQLVVRLKLPVKNMPVGTELGYRDVPDAIAALGSAAFFDVVRDQQGNPIPPLTPEEIEAAQRAAQRRAKSRRLIVGADFDPLWDRVEGIPSAEELTDMQAAVDAVADVPPRVEAVETALPLAMTRTNAAGYSTLQDALNAGAGETVYIGPGAYQVSSALTVAPGTTVELHPNAVIEQTTAWTPVFDLLDSPGTQVIGGQFEWNGPRVRESVPNTRGSSSAMMSAGVWTNSHRSRVIGSQIFGFMAAVNISGWDTTAGARIAGRTRDVLVQDVDVDTVAFGVLAAGTTNMQVADLRGSYASFTAGSVNPEPPHLIYVSESGGNATMNAVPTIRDCFTASGDVSFAYQFKGITGGSARNLGAGTVPRLLHIMHTTGFAVEGASAVQTTDAGAYNAVDIETAAPADVTNCTVRDVWVGHLGVDGRLARVTGTGNLVEKVSGTAQTATGSTSAGYTNVMGTRNTVRDIEVVETGAASLNGVHANSGSGHVIERIRATGIASLARIAATDVTLSYDPKASSASNAGMVNLNAPTTTRLVLPPTRVVATITGGAITPDPSRQTTTAVTATAATLTVNNPPNNTSAAGAQHTVEITNGGSGVLTVTWGTAYVFGPAWVSPAAGKTTFITFTYNGTNWVEVSRTA